MNAGGEAGCVCSQPASCLIEELIKPLMEMSMLKSSRRLSEDLRQGPESSSVERRDRHPWFLHARRKQILRGSSGSETGGPLHLWGRGPAIRMASVRRVHSER